MKMTKNLTHIASSVEFEPAMTEEQLEALRGCGVKLVQGFLFSRPIPVEEYEKKYAVARPVPEGLPPSGRCA